MSRGSLDSEPGYWENAFKAWYPNYTDSKFRKGVVHMKHFSRSEFDPHNLSHETKAPSTNKESVRQYKAPWDIPYPRECAKTLRKYYDCRISYKVHSIVDDVPQCNYMKDEVFEDCPHWVLENVAMKKRFYKRAEMIDNMTYRRAMEVSDYNK